MVHFKIILNKHGPRIISTTRIEMKGFFKDFAQYTEQRVDLNQYFDQYFLKYI